MAAYNMVLAAFLAHQAVAQQTNGNCQTPFKEEGNCVLTGSCPTLDNVITNQTVLRRYVCGFRRNKPKLCCPTTSQEGKPFAQLFTTTTPAPTSPTAAPEPPPFTLVAPKAAGNSGAAIKPLEPPKPIKNYPSFLPGGCGISNISSIRIVAGKISEVGAWPWMAAIYLKTSDKDKIGCGGALVSPKHILTAAHCVSVGVRATKLPARVFSVRLGDHDLSSADDNTLPIDVDVSAVHRHPSYDRRTYSNDVAVLELSKEVSFNQFVQPVCLPFGEISKKDVTGYHGFIAGWGATQFTGEGSSVLREAQIPIWEEAECRKAYERHLPIEKTQLCAGDANGKKDSCQGDSGGPLVLPFEGRYYVLGVVSSGKDCATPGFPGIYTRVTSYLDWLKGIIN
ncbi:venom protease [Ixodes scapularis]|uniref:venom protease n=1 Tax=Ixodes scapularis TaxID=6945 RepID=UPI001A9E60A8|nr:venom protease [Ixodes scapularis]